MVPEGLHRVRGAQIRLLLQVDDDRSLVPVRCVPQDPALDLRLIAAGRGPAVEHGDPDDRDRKRGRKLDSPTH